MTTRYNPTTGKIVYQGEINALLGASVPPSADLSSKGYYPLIDLPMPAITRFQSAVLGSPALVGGQWQRAWVVSDRPIAEVRAEMSCTKLQAKLALAQLGLAAAFVAYRNALAADPVANFVQLAFTDDAETWQRLDDTFNAAADALEKTEVEKDQFFMLAETL